MLLTIDEILKVLDDARGAAEGFSDFDPYPELEGFTFDPVQRLTEPSLQNIQPEAQPTKVPSLIKHEATKEVAAQTRANPELAKLPTYKDFSPSDWMAKYENGKIPLKALTPIGNGHYMRKDAAQAYKAMRRSAKKAGINFSITDSYRTYEQQVVLEQTKGKAITATPGTSNHGWGIALDINVNDGRVYQWLKAHGKKFGFHQLTDPWEPWHWEYRGGYRAAYKKQPGPRPKKLIEPTEEAVDLIAPRSSLVSPLMFVDTVAQVARPKRGPRDIKNFEGGGLGFVPKRFRQFFAEAGKKYGIAPRLLAAMVKVKENPGFDPKIVNSAGAHGLMQVMASAHPNYNPKKLLNARYNIMAGAAIFASYLNKANGNLRLALAFYNAGPNASQGLLQQRMVAYSDPILEFWRNN